jgi:hypothetical protein
MSQLRLQQALAEIRERMEIANELRSIANIQGRLTMRLEMQGRVMGLVEAIQIVEHLIAIDRSDQ